MWDSRPGMRALSGASRSGRWTAGRCRSGSRHERDGDSGGDRRPCAGAGGAERHHAALECGAGGRSGRPHAAPARAGRRAAHLVRAGPVGRAAGGWDHRGPIRRGVAAGAGVSAGRGRPARIGHGGRRCCAPRGSAARNRGGSSRGGRRWPGEARHSSLASPAGAGLGIRTSPAGAGLGIRTRPGEAGHVRARPGGVGHSIRVRPGGAARNPRGRPGGARQRAHGRRSRRGPGNPADRRGDRGHGLRLCRHLRPGPARAGGRPRHGRGARQRVRTLRRRNAHRVECRRRRGVAAAAAPLRSGGAARGRRGPGVRRDAAAACGGEASPAGGDETARRQSGAGRGAGGGMAAGGRRCRCCYRLGGRRGAQSQPDRRLDRCAADQHRRRSRAGGTDGDRGRPAAWSGARWHIPPVLRRRRLLRAAADRQARPKPGAGRRRNRIGATRRRAGRGRAA